MFLKKWASDGKNEKTVQKCDSIYVKRNEKSLCNPLEFLAFLIFPKIDFVYFFLGSMSKTIHKITFQSISI